MSGDGNDGESQLRIWESASRRQQLGELEDEESVWEVHLVVEKASRELFRGRLAFRRADDHLLTAPVLVEESEEAVVRRAEELSDSMLRQFLVSVRG